MKLNLFAAAALVLPAVRAATGDVWRGQSIYQVFTDRFARSDNSTTAGCNLNDYCGGSWRGIINRLDYIQSMGFTAVWISPVTQNVQGLTNPDGNSYHGYWQNDLYALNSKFGTAQDLKDLSAALHKRNMLLMVDIVVNHFGWEGAANTVQYPTYTPFNDAKYFHPYCPINYNDAVSIKQCWMGSSTVELPDLNTTRSDVRSMYGTWIKQLVGNYSIDGLRIDTCLEVEQDFFTGFRTAAGVYSVCECDNGDPAVVSPYQSVIDGTLNYPLYFPIIQAFQSTSGSISNLVNNFNTIKSKFKDSTLLAPFTENHDQPRFASLTSDMALAQNAIAFGMLADGPSIIYQGQEQHYNGGSVPSNRETIWTSGYNQGAPLYNFIAKVNSVRNHAIYADGNYRTSKASILYSDTTTVVTTKGSAGKAILAVFTNKGSNGASYQQSYPGGNNSGLGSNTKVVEVITCATATTDSNGNVNVGMGSGAIKIYTPAAFLAGSGICSL